ncbi:hypothetical protein H2200_012162 [Cladophialophora chaetospira]|uniref:Nucleoside phosphorylase domain-containing protein n=1 Tax=Cladophialophora chaetospira TaxID=386627 RepID=A0AA38WYC4_9EURO|nr:hypothetical protein H2200_012162 [Cladophialophora chaetospira]
MSKSHDPQSYTVGWVCAITTEYVAAQAFLDDQHDGPEHVSVNDNNDYTLGRVGQHNVVIAVAPVGEYGTQSAATVARDMMHTFPNVRIGLMVGIAGGAPSPKHDIRLGDIVVSAPSDGKGGVFQYDYGKAKQGQDFETTGYLNQPPPILRSAVNGLKAQYMAKGNQLEQAVDAALKRMPRLKKSFGRPVPSADKLYLAECVHPQNEESGCDEVCSKDPKVLIPRDPRTTDEDNPAVHYGLIGSANRVMKDALARDKLAAKGVLCFEMEAAGLMNHFPCLVIRGICDYSDSHKNKAWQGYAAMVAAAYAKNLLCRIRPNSVEAERKLIDVIAGVQEDVAQISKGMERIVRKDQSEERQTIINWITALDFTLQQRDYINQRQAGTGGWFLESNEFLCWLETPSQRLFCPGIPGAGKTVIASIVIDHLSNSFEKDPSVGVAYVFCDFRRQEEQSPQELFSSLLRQLVQAQPQIPNPIRQLYQTYCPKFQKLSSTEIITTLNIVAASYSKLFIVIDALDEFRTVRGCRTEFLSMLLDFQIKSGANLLVTSRFNDDIGSQFLGVPSLRIYATDQDVERYLDEEVRLMRPEILDDDSCNMIKAEIARAASGMFLLAKLRMPMLADMPTKGHMKNALKELAAAGNQLSDLYEQALVRITAQGQEVRELAMHALSWIVHAKRPLSPEELRHALAVKLDTTELDTDYLPSTKLILSFCVGLITIDPESDIIRLVHYSTQEYLQLEETQNRWFPNAQTDITRTCVTYLSYDKFKAGFCPSDEEYAERLQENPLYLYASSNWGYHARYLPDRCEYTMRFLRKRAQVEASSQALLVARHASHYGHSQQAPKDISSLHLAAFFGIDRVALELLASGHEIDVRDSYKRTPLWWAAQNGQATMIKVLLDEGSALEAKDKSGKTPLSRAAESGHDEAIKLLIERGATVDSEDDRACTPLLLAARQGHEAAVMLLASHGAFLDSSDSLYGRTPLWWAVQNMHEETAKLLAQLGADPMTRDKSGQTLLHWSIITKRERVVQLIVNLQAHLSAGFFYDQSILWFATKEDNAAVLRLILDNEPFEADLSDDHRRTPLSHAASYGQTEIVRVLLGTGKTDPDLADDRGRTPLSYAAANGHEEVVQLLLDTGRFTPDSADEHEETPLGKAAYNGHTRIVRLLLDTGQFNPAFPNRKKRTPLFYAASEGHEEIVRMLLNTGRCNPDWNDRWWREPFRAAIKKGHRDVARMLNPDEARLLSGAGKRKLGPDMVEVLHLYAEFESSDEEGSEHDEEVKIRTLDADWRQRYRDEPRELWRG